MIKLVSTLSLLFLVIILIIAMAALTDYYNRAPNAAGAGGSFAVHYTPQLAPSFAASLLIINRESKKVGIQESIYFLFS